METFTSTRGLVDNPCFLEQREAALRDLDMDEIDTPITDIVEGFRRIPYCFTLQCCYGHFTFPGREDPHNIEPLLACMDDMEIKYRIAYSALCVEDCAEGRGLLAELMDVPALDPSYIQFGCATWFWERQPNSYVLQVEPDRYKDRDTAAVPFAEAVHLEKTRDLFFEALRRILLPHMGRPGC